MLGRLFPFRQISGEFGLNFLFCPLLRIASVSLDFYPDA